MIEIQVLHRLPDAITSAIVSHAGAAVNRDIHAMSSTIATTKLNRMHNKDNNKRRILAVQPRGAVHEGPGGVAKALVWVKCRRWRHALICNI